MERKLITYGNLKFTNLVTRGGGSVRRIEGQMGGQNFELASFREGPLEVYGSYEDGTSRFLGYLKDLQRTCNVWGLMFPTSAIKYVWSTMWPSEVAQEALKEVV